MLSSSLIRLREKGEDFIPYSDRAKMTKIKNKLYQNLKVLSINIFYSLKYFKKITCTLLREIISQMWNIF